MAEVDALHTLTLGDVLREHARSYPEHIAVVCGDERFAYPGLHARVRRLTSALAALGVGNGERVLWLGQNCHRFLETLIATASLGAICCPVNWRNSADEMAFVIDDAAPVVIIWQDEEIGDRIRMARQQVAHQARWVQHDNGEYEALIAPANAIDGESPVDPDVPVLMLYTAAFAGEPSGALLSQTAMLWQSLVWGATHDFTDQTVYLASEPMFHVAGVMNLIGTFHRGGTNVFTRRVNAEQLCRLVETERCTTAYFVDTTIDKIVELNRDGRFDLKSLRSPPRTPDWDAMVTLGTSAWDREMGGYGQTETMGMVTYHCLGSRPLPGVQARIVDEHGVDVRPGEIGELVTRGPTMMHGYYERAELNGRRRRDDWHHTNDVARRADDGSLAWLGSMDRLIKSGSENVYPAEVEACIEHHPAVTACRVVGTPDAQWGERVEASVVLVDGARATEQDIIGHCRQHLAGYKCPRTVRFVDELSERS